MRWRSPAVYRLLRLSACAASLAKPLLPTCTSVSSSHTTAHSCHIPVIPAHVHLELQQPIRELQTCKSSKRRDVKTAKGGRVFQLH